MRNLTSDSLYFLFRTTLVRVKFLVEGQDKGKESQKTEKNELSEMLRMILLVFLEASRARHALRRVGGMKFESVQDICVFLDIASECSN